MAGWLGRWLRGVASGVNHGDPVLPLDDPLLPGRKPDFHSGARLKTGWFSSTWGLLALYGDLLVFREVDEPQGRLGMRLVPGSLHFSGWAILVQDGPVRRRFTFGARDEVGAHSLTAMELVRAWKTALASYRAG